MERFVLVPCLDALFAGTPDGAALDQIARAGLDGFEFWDWRTRDVSALRTRARQLGLRAVAFSGNTFDEPLVEMEAHPQTLRHLSRSIEVAQRLGVRLLVVHVGYAQTARPRRALWEAAVQGLRAAGDLARSEEVTVLVEPLNSVLDHPGYFLDTLPDALRLLREVDHPAVRLLLDIYHMRMMHEDLLDNLAGALPVTAHVHVADVPGRGEPGSGAVQWSAFAQILHDAHYRGSLGLECWPTNDRQQALRRSREVLVV